MKYLFTFIILCLIVSCSQSDEQIFCTEEFVYGLSVTVRNSDTNEIIKEGITVIATDGPYSEELSTIEGIDNFFGAGERSGNYIITVLGNEYQMFVSDLIEVNEDSCHVIPQSFQILLISN